MTNIIKINIILSLIITLSVHADTSIWQRASQTKSTQSTLSVEYILDKEELCDQALTNASVVVPMGADEFVTFALTPSKVLPAA